MGLLHCFTPSWPPGFLSWIKYVANRLFEVWATETAHVECAVQGIAHLSSAGEWSRSDLDTSELWQHMLDKWKILAYSRDVFHLFKCHTSAVSIHGFREGQILGYFLSDLTKRKLEVSLTAQMLNVIQIATHTSYSGLKTFMMKYIIYYLSSFQTHLYYLEISGLYLNQFSYLHQ